MINTLTLNNPLRSVFSARQHIGEKILMAFLGSVLIAIAAQIQIPLQPVPVTLQDIAVLFIGMSFGWRLGSLTVMLYLLEGLAGLPFFANHAGIAELMSPLGGYLIAFVPAAALSGYLVEKGWGRRALTTLLAGLAGLTIIFAGGLLMLANFIGWQPAIHAGLMPFMLTSSAKLLILAVIVPKLWKQ